VTSVEVRVQYRDFSRMTQWLRDNAPGARYATGKRVEDQSSLDIVVDFPHVDRALMFKLAFGGRR
jgi:hypothetical protein